MSTDPFQEFPKPSPELLQAIDAVVLEHMRRPFINRNELVEELASAVLGVTQTRAPFLDSEVVIG